MIEFSPVVIYLIVVGIAGAVLIWWSRNWVTHVEKRRRTRIKKLKRFDAVKTTTPFDSPVTEAKESALESVEARFSIIRKLTFISIVLLWIIALVFPFLGKMPATAVSVLVTTTGIILGIAARPFIENVISGIVISVSHPIRVGDTVIVDDNYGTVEDITLTHTMIKVWDWRRYIVPNNQMLKKEIVNCTISDPYIWKYATFHVAYEHDPAFIKSVAVEAAKDSRYFADHEDPRFWVMDMDENGYQCWVAAWADSAMNAWELGNDIRTNLVTKFRENNIKTHRLEINTGTKPANI